MNIASNQHLKWRKNKPENTMVDTSKQNAMENLMDSVDLSNSCREFYQARRKAAETVKEKLASSGRQQKTKPTSLDTAILKLRMEMASLMDKDLGLMKQLLNLNEAIEDLKWQKRTSFVPTPTGSSCALGESDWSVSETDMYESESDVELRTQEQSVTHFQVKMRNLQKTATETTNEMINTKDGVVTKSSDTESDGSELLRPPSTSSNRLSISFETRKFLDLPSELDEFLNGPCSPSDEFLNGPCSPSDEENSCDSGIHESDFWPELHADV